MLQTPAAEFSFHEHLFNQNNKLIIITALSHQNFAEIFFTKRVLGLQGRLNMLIPAASSEFKKQGSFIKPTSYFCF